MDFEDTFPPTEYGMLRRQRASLMRRMIHNNEHDLKQRIRDITHQITALVSSKNQTN